jgi:hypothetical protein
MTEATKCRLGALWYLSKARDLRLAGTAHKFVARNIETARLWGRLAITDGVITMRMLGSHLDIEDFAAFEKAFSDLADATDEDCERADAAAREQQKAELSA